MSDSDHINDSFISEISQLLSTVDITYFKKDDNILDIICSMLEKNHYDDTGFFIVDISTVIAQYLKWIHALPRIEPFYAIKSNPNPMIIKTLAILGTGFDCASKNEITLVLDVLRKELKKDSAYITSHIIFANTAKVDQHVRYSRSVDVDMMTFDNDFELVKIAYFHPDARLVLRIKVNDAGSLCRLNDKFGAKMSRVESLIKSAKTLHLDIIGVSFHVGSRCQDPSSFASAIADAKKVFEIAKIHGYKLTLLDIGGGFPGTRDDTFFAFAEQINKSLDEHFSTEEFDDSYGLKIIAEPGRFFCSASHTLVLNVIAKDKDVEDGKTTCVYTLSDGLYGALNGIMYDHAVPIIKPFNEREGKTYECHVYGPTCDSIDKLVTCQLPELANAECVYIEDCGAYSTAAASRFNGINLTPCTYIMRH